MKKVTVLVLCSLCLFTAKSSTYYTISAGAWSSAANWSTGVAPTYSVSDTIVLRHFMTIANNLELNSGAYILIDTNAALCGHIALTINSGAEVLKYGLLELDNLYVMGGASCQPPGDVVLTYYASLSGNGSMNVNCFMIVGSWFDCRPAAMSIENIDNSDFIAFPNPAKEKITIELADWSRFRREQLASVAFYDVTGRAVLSIPIQSAKNTIDVSSLSAGVYTAVLCEKGIPISRKKIIIE